MGFAFMEDRNGILCWTGCIAEADSDLHCRSNRKIEREGVVPSDPEAIAIFIKLHAPHVARVGLETGATATWLWTELNKLGLPVVCIDARHAKAALRMQINKSDRNDAVGIARIMQCGWYKEVRVKDLDSHAIKALLVSRALLVKIKRDVENQIRGLLKNLGLVIGRAKMNVFAVRAGELIQDRPELAAAVAPLLKIREVIERQIADLDRKVMRMARNDIQVRRFMTVPGVGPITALCYRATIDDPTRVKKSRSVGAYAGLTTRRYASARSTRVRHRFPGPPDSQISEEDASLMQARSRASACIPPLITGAPVAGPLRNGRSAALQVLVLCLSQRWERVRSWCVTEFTELQCGTSAATQNVALSSKPQPATAEKRSAA